MTSAYVLWQFGEEAVVGSDAVQALDLTLELRIA
jgi:hypothetical protein